MFWLWILAVVFLDIISCSCPSGYTLQWHGICIKMAQNGGSHTYGNLLSDAVKLCDPGTPVVIRSQEEQDYWANIAKNYSYPLVLDIVCNQVTKAYEWDDGSTINYKPAGVNSNINANCASQGFTWAMSTSGIWTAYNPTASGTINLVIYCMKPAVLITPVDDECGYFTSDDGACYQVGKTAETWIDAQSICKQFGGNMASVHNAQENSFIRRMAVSNGQVNGVMLGASLTGKSNNFTWIDGTAWDYDNFEGGFPIDGLGSCVAMDTNNVNGKWVNVPCGDEMQFACVRRSGDEEHSCGDAVRTEGEVIYSPGFPNNASSPCDFFLKVDTNKLVEVEILFFEANSCCDKLILEEGSLGGNVIATLTGEIVNGTKYKTKSSNVMRASWQPNGGVNVRGMMITFRGV